MKNINICGEMMNRKRKRRQIYKPKAMQGDRLASAMANKFDKAFSYGKGSVRVGLKK